MNYKGCAISKTLPNGLTIGFLRSPAKGAPIRVVLVGKGWELLVSGQQYALAGQIGAKKLPVNAIASDTERGSTVDNATPTRSASAPLVPSVAKRFASAFAFRRFGRQKSQANAL